MLLNQVRASSVIGALLLMLTATVPSLPALATAGSPHQELRTTLFRASDDALAAANDAQASLLAPQSYGQAADAYRRAEAMLEAGGGIDAIQRNLRRAESLFEQAAQAAGIARETFAEALKARADAAGAKAEEFEPDAWKAAEQALGQATLRLERGRDRNVERDGAKAKDLFQQAELAAIKSNYLNKTRSLLETANQLRAPRHAPLSYQQARELLAAAEQALTDDRYDTDRPRNLAQRAEHMAHHAIYVARLERSIRDGDTSVERILLDWQSGIAAIAHPLDVPVYFDDGYTDAVQRISRAIATLQADLSFLRQGMADRDAQIASLELELGGQSQSLARVNQALARRDRQRERIERVESLFPVDQALVLRQGDSIILRLIGLSFASGSANLTAEHEPILARVEQALSSFPEANIIIEGHTDSFGSDAANQALSQDRAAAVLQYLLARTPISPADVRALGYGESRPVANNETPEGRARNRRIDIIIYPKW
ncbi:MAG: OmpA family protein [Pseudomonadales bacterium]